MGLKQKTITGLSWSFIDNFAVQGIQLIAGIILARLLVPKEFGLIGIITIFIAISQTFIDSGFKEALIRKKNCKQEDYCTVFYFNIMIGIFFFLILYFSAGIISKFFNEPELLLLIRVLGIILIISSLGLIQRTILIKNINFKIQTKISVISSIISGIVGIGMAYTGFGVWSLVVRTLVQEFLTTSLLWTFNEWKPSWIFSRHSFRELFGYSSKLLISSLIDTSYRHIFNLVIGKFYSAAELGYYTRADQFRNIPSSSLNTVVQRVTFPVLSTIQDDNIKLKNGYKKVVKSTMLISFVLMIGMAAIAKPMIITLIGEKWLPAVPYLQLLCFSGMLYPLHSLNLSILSVKGRSDLHLKLEIIKKLLAIPIIFLGIFWGIKVMLFGMIISSLISYFINSFWSGKLIDYSMKDQISDITPSFIIALLMGCFVYFISLILPLGTILVMSIQICFGTIFTVLILELIKLSEYIEMKEIIFNKFNKNKISNFT